MDHLAAISLEELQDALDAVEGSRPAQRLIAAIAHKEGISQSELARWFGVERKTIYNWLMRLESGDLPEAVQDENRPGRQRKLGPAQRETVQQLLQESPAVVGFDARSWTPTLLQAYLAETYDVDYSIPSCRRLLKEAGLVYRRPTESDDVDRGLGPMDQSNDESMRRKRWLPE